MQHCADCEAPLSYPGPHNVTRAGAIVALCPECWQRDIDAGLDEIAARLDTAAT